MRFKIGKKEDQKLNDQQRVERLKKAVKIAMRAPHHVKKMAEKGNIQNVQDTLDKFDKAKTLEDIEASFEEIKSNNKDLGIAFEAEVAEIASSSGFMLGLSSMLTSHFSKSLSLPLAVFLHLNAWA